MPITVSPRSPHRPKNDFYLSQALYNILVMPPQNLANQDNATRSNAIFRLKNPSKSETYLKDKYFSF
jgi:hypothetical protein